MANTNELEYSRKVADGERLELIMRQVASRFKLDGNVLAEALLDIHERLKAVEGATEELTSSDRWKAFKTVQLVKPSPSASGDTVTAIDTVAQDGNGELTATKKNIRQGTTSQTGIVQLSDATNSTSTTLAATANAVKTAYDLAASKQDAVSTDTDSSDFSDATAVATGFGSDKIHFNVASRLWNYIKGKLGISSSGSSTKFLNEQGEFVTVTSPDVSGKADKVTGATAGDVATLDANGNLVDSGVTLDPSTNTISANISGNAATANALATPRKIDGVEFDGSGDVIHYGECNTAATVQAKVIACPGFVLTTAARIIIKFTQDNNFREPTFNVNNTGAVPVRYFGSLLPSANFLRTGAVYQFIYDGTNYCFVGNFDNNNCAYQTALSNNAEYPVLCKNNANQTAENNFVRYASGITMNPSTNKVTASGGFVGNLSGNAATASEAAIGSTLESKINSKQDDLGISSSGSSTKFLNEQGEWTTVTSPDVSNKLDKDGLGDDVRVQFTQSPSRTNIVTTSKLSVLFGKIQKWFADMGALAFKDKVDASDVESGTYPIDISGNATTATTASSTSSGTILANADLNNYNTANRNYLCNASSASSVSNRPTGASGAFELEVIRGTGSACVQVYYSRDDVNFNYIRKYTGSNTWTAWDRLSLASDVNGAYFATYGSTSHADVLAAIQAGKAVFCKSGTDYAPLASISTGGVITFTKPTVAGLAAYYQLSSSGKWTSGTSEDCRVAFSAVSKAENTTDGCALTFTAIDGSTKRMTVKNVVNAGNADTVDGYHIVVGSTGTDSNTIYFT